MPVRSRTLGRKEMPLDGKGHTVSTSTIRSRTRTPARPEPSSTRGRRTALALATVGFAVNFWAWSLLSPLAPKYKDLLGLSSLSLSILVAVPVIVGSLGRIPLGVLTDRYGGRRMFAAVSLLCLVPVLFLAVAQSFPALLVGGFLLGLAGATFAIGVPFVSAWFPPERQGFALGIYGMGNIGTAVSGFFSPRLYSAWGARAPYLVVAAFLLAVALAFIVLGRDAPQGAPSGESFMSRFRSALRLRITRDLALLYAVTFGGFVAFGVYLPAYLKTAYHLTVTDAATRTAGFVVLATLARPIGGWLADRLDGARVLQIVLGVVALGAVTAAFTPVMPLLTVAMLSIGAALGIGNGVIFALVGQRGPAGRVGSMTGVIGTAGGLGGFLPPIVMGAIYEVTGSYAIGLMLLSDVALAALVFTAWRLGHSTS